jgi:hypothetical protein
MTTTPLQIHWLRQEWVHAHEEDTGDTRVFRPASHPLPPSRGRRTLDLRKEGLLTQSQPGADDRRTRETGVWSLEGQTLTLRSGSPAAPPDQLEIVALEKNRLVLRKP